MHCISKLYGLDENNTTFEFMVNFIIFIHRCKTVNKLESMNKIVYSLKRSTTEVLDCLLYKVVGYLKVKHAFHVKIIFK
jgi:hypothetical protein